MTAREQQIQALYQAALARPPAERASFVAQLSGTDDELRRSVELLLSQQDPTDVGSRSKKAEPDELPAGTQLGH